MRTVLIAILAVLATSCAEERTDGIKAVCERRPCQKLVVAGREPLATSRIAVNGAAFPLNESPTRVEYCTASVLPFERDTARDKLPPTFSQRLAITCAVGGSSLYAEVALGDTRVVTTTVSQEVSGWLDESTCRIGGSALMRRTETAGDAAPFPTMVTANYRRVFEVSGTAGGCASLSFTFQFESVAADFSGDSDAVCEECLL